MEQTVEQTFEINLSQLQDIADTSAYWRNACDFYISVKDKYMSNVSTEELEWLEKIEAEL